MIDRLIKEQHSFPLGAVERAVVELKIRSGSMRVGGGSSEFCDAVFEFWPEEMRPIVEFDAEAEASFEVEQPDAAGLQHVRSSWDLRFNDQVPIELATACASGNATLDLDTLNVLGLDVKAASGSVRASLDGSYPELDEVTVNLASGNCELSLGGSSPALELVEVDVTSGWINLGITGKYVGLRRVEANSASGNIHLDLRGEFQRDDLGVRISAMSGNVTAHVPSDIGVSLNASVLSGRVRAEGFSADSGRMTNSVFGQSQAAIWLNIQVTSGNISVVSG